MNWNIVLIGVIAVLTVVIAMQVREIRHRTRERNWELDCPLAKGQPLIVNTLTPKQPPVGETVWDRTIREVGDPDDVLTTGPELDMPGSTETGAKA